jgi:hypothetical protein
MDLPQINVAVEELMFSLFQRPLHPELFKIYANRKVNTEKYEAVIWVTGCTHVVSVFVDVNYMTDFQVEKMSPNLYRQSHSDLERFARNRGVFVKFPELQIGKLQPFCYVDFEARQTELHLHTFAAYPDQVTMIKTQSLFDFSTT